MNSRNLIVRVGLLCLLLVQEVGIGWAQPVPPFYSPTEGVLTSSFVEEPEMQFDLLQMLANFMTYVKADFQRCDTLNSRGEECGCFRGEDTMAANERGVRPNADLSMVCAFLVKYGPGRVSLPPGIQWEEVRQMARQSLAFAYSTHKANRLMACKRVDYWGSVSLADHTWESSLWALSVAYSAFFQQEELLPSQKQAVYNLLKAECNYQLERTIPTGYQGDTKAEENGWETNVLACALGLYPNDPLAPQWFQRLRAFAINCYSQRADAYNNTVIDPAYDSLTVADLYVGPNLYDDFTLQNHNLFHTSYQNVVMQELGESQLALQLFQGDSVRWNTRALMHNNQMVMDHVLKDLALADGELAMPNGNDWSLFLYDQITSYTTLACFLRDPDALMLENLAYKHVKARQQTTPDGSWLLHPDVGARRMGVQAHRVMMTWLMHELASTASLRPTAWTDFSARHEKARLFESQQIVRASSPQRFSCFSWSEGLRSYTGYFTANRVDCNKVVVPYRAHNTGNMLGWYKVKDKHTDARPVGEVDYRLMDNSYLMTGALQTNQQSLCHRFAFYATPGNALMYLDEVTALEPVVLEGVRGGLLAISTDPFTKQQRLVQWGTVGHWATAVMGTSEQETLQQTGCTWANIDSQIGVVLPVEQPSAMAFADRSLENSIYTTKFYTFYSNVPRSVEAGALVDNRAVTYYCLVDSSDSSYLQSQNVSLRSQLPKGWNGLLAADPDGVRYIMVSHFSDSRSDVTLTAKVPGGVPVWNVPTDICKGRFTVRLSMENGHSWGSPAYAYIMKGTVTALQAEDGLWLTNPLRRSQQVTLRVLTPEHRWVVKKVRLKSLEKVLIL